MRRSELGLRLRRSVAAGIAQLVEHHLAKVGVAGSSPVSRSDFTGRLRSGGPPRGVWGRIVSQSPPHRRRGQVVRQRTANPLSPVRIRAAPLTRGLITAHEPRTTAASEKPTARITEASAASQVIRAAPRRAKYARRGFLVSGPNPAPALDPFSLVGNAPPPVPHPKQRPIEPWLRPSPGLKSRDGRQTPQVADHGTGRHPRPSHEPAAGEAGSNGARPGGRAQTPRNA